MVTSDWPTNQTNFSKDWILIRILVFQTHTFFFFTPPSLGISGLFHILCSTSYLWSLTFTSADSPHHVVPDFDLRRNHARAHDAYSWMHTFDQSCHKSMWASDYIFSAMRSYQTHFLWLHVSGRHWKASHKDFVQSGGWTQDLQIMSSAVYRLAMSTPNSHYCLRQNF